MIEGESSLQNEVEESPEEQIKRVGSVVYSNLQELGLIDSLVSQSRHGSVYPPGTFNHVDFYSAYAVRNDGIFIIPHIKSESPGQQPVAIKSHRLAKEEQAQLELCEKIWNGVSNEDRVGVARYFIKRKIAENQSTLNNVDWPDYYSQDDIKKVKDEAQEKIDLLTKLENSIESLPIKINSSADLVIKLK
jgi:hypothetical protein